MFSEEGGAAKAEVLLILCVCSPGSVATVVQCPCCPARLSGEEELQEHINSQHMGQSSCPLCSLVCTSQLELQEHLLSCHMEAQVEQEPGQEQASTSQAVRASYFQLGCKLTSGKYYSPQLDEQMLI